MVSIIGEKLNEKWICFPSKKGSSECISCVPLKEKPQSVYSCSTTVIPQRDYFVLEGPCVRVWVLILSLAGMICCYVRAECVYRPWLCSRDTGGRGWSPHRDSTLLRSFRSSSWIRMTGSISRRLLLPWPTAPPAAAPLQLALLRGAAALRCKAHKETELDPPAEDRVYMIHLWLYSSSWLQLVIIHGQKE